LKEYQEKYGNYGNLLQFTKEEVSSFDKGNEGRKLTQELGEEYTNFLLADRSWWLIGDTYYEVPLKVKGVKGEKAKHVKHVSTHAHKCPISFNWVKKINKKAAIITTACVLGVSGGLVGGHFIYKAVQENKTILQKMGGSVISKEEAKNMCSSFKLNIADSVDVSANIKKFEITDAASEYIDHGIATESYPLNFKWNNIALKDNISYRDILALEGFDTIGQKSDTATPVDIDDDTSVTSTKMQGSLTSINMLLFHQAYDYVFDQFVEAVDKITIPDKIEVKYLNDKNTLGIYINVSDLSTFIKDAKYSRNVNFTGEGSLECGLKFDENGFINRFIFKVNGDKVDYKSNIYDDKTYRHIVGKFDINVDVSLTRKIAQPIEINYYINGKTVDEYIAGGGKGITAPTVYVVDPLGRYNVETEEFEGVIESKQNYAYTNRTYRAFFKIEDGYALIPASSGIYIDNIECTHDDQYGLNLLCNFYDYTDSENFNKYVEIDRTVLSENHTYTVNIDVVKIK